MYEEFQAMAQGKCDYTLPVIKTETTKFGPMMTIMATEEAIYITKEQAMEFFGLVDPGDNPKWDI